jgi:uncharacterized membrane protein YccC
MVGTPPAIQAATALVFVTIALGGIVKRYVVDPYLRDLRMEVRAAHKQGEQAMSRANTALDRAEAAETQAADTADRLDDQLEDITTALDRIEAKQVAQAREARGRTHTLARLIEAIDQADEIDTSHVPDVDRDDFLRGGDSTNGEQPGSD